MNRRIIFGAVACALLSPGTGLAVGAPPSGREEVVSGTPVYEGATANAPIPPEQHIRNEGGSDGAGLCVISSVLANGRYQQVPGLEGGKESGLWKAAKSRPGGYYPEKLADLVDGVMPGEKYASYTGTDPEILERLSKMGYPVGATMNTGELYGWAPIHHMISLVHFDRQSNLACVVDNNDPGKYHWLSATEFSRRWVDGETGWAWIWTRLESVALEPSFDLVLFVLAVAITVVVIGRVRRARARPSPA